jgi:hypothetical protein
MGTVFAICRFGFGARIASLIGAYYWAQKLNFNLKIYWEKNSECDCEYVDIFSTKSECLIDKIEPSVDFILNADYMQFKNQNNTSSVFNKCINPEHLQQYVASYFPYTTILYNYYTVPGIITDSEIANILSQFKLHSHLINRANQFIKTNNISHEDCGLLLRKTDAYLYNFETNTNDVSRIIKESINQRFFVTSDDKETEQLFYNYPNVLTLKKKEFVYYSQKDNILFRSKQSVFDGIVSMLILSYTYLFSSTNYIFIMNKHTRRGSGFLLGAYYYSLLNK